MAIGNSRIQVYVGGLGCANRTNALHHDFLLRFIKDS